MSPRPTCTMKTKLTEKSKNKESGPAESPRKDKTVKQSAVQDKNANEESSGKECTKVLFEHF